VDNSGRKMLTAVVFVGVFFFILYVINIYAFLLRKKKKERCPA
jgi:cbb3-type cytochrome oxidase subunit 3